ncbi:MAG: hypothetical protein J6K88_04605 [Oscillospiraceae bacterium]|nr:hypothetical protein [Oscillospiraceae bacterium]
MLTNIFISLCREFAKENPNMFEEHIEDSKKICKYSIEFLNYILEFRYIKKESIYFKPSSLYCVIKLRKNSIVYYHLTDIIPYVEQKIFKACYFSNIETPERLKTCFESLKKQIKNIIPQIVPFLYDETTLLNHLLENYKAVFKLKDSDMDFSQINNENSYAHDYFLTLQNIRDGYIFSRFSNFAPYALLIKNKIDKAIAKYEKLNQKDKLLEYEKLLLEHISNSTAPDVEIFESYCDTSAKSSKFMTFSSFAKAFVVVFAISSVLLCGIFALYNLILSQNTIVMLSAPWYMGFLCAGICSIFGAIALFPYIPNKHLTKEERKNFSNILISKGLKKFSFVCFLLSVLVSLFSAIMMMLPNVRFYEDNIKFDMQSYNYNQIDSVYYINARYNVYGDRIERASYVILFDDKTSLDLDGYTSVEFTKKEVLPLLKSKGFNVKNADSERELPWYSE